MCFKVRTAENFCFSHIFSQAAHQATRLLHPPFDKKCSISQRLGATKSPSAVSSSRLFFSPIQRDTAAKPFFKEEGARWLWPSSSSIESHLLERIKRTKRIDAEIIDILGCQRHKGTDSFLILVIFPSI